MEPPPNMKLNVLHAPRAKHIVYASGITRARSMDRLKWPGINETTAEPRGPALTRLKPQVLCCAFRVMVQGTQRPGTSLWERERIGEKENCEKDVEGEGWNDNLPWLNGWRMLKNSNGNLKELSNFSFLFSSIPASIEKISDGGIREYPTFPSFVRQRPVYPSPPCPFI